MVSQSDTAAMHNINKTILKEVVREELRTYLREMNGGDYPFESSSILIREELDKNDIEEIRDLIRHELADVFFQLFKKRATWI